MRKILLALSLLTAVSSYALTVDEMLARLNKVKQKSKHRHGVVIERYLNVQSELAPSRFADGTTEPLEGIFINRRRIEGRTAREITLDQTTFGLGVTSVDFTFGGTTFDRLFYERDLTAPRASSR